MRGTTHLSGGILTGEILLALLPEASVGAGVAICVGAAIGSLMPDIDAGQSKISNTSLATKITGYTFSAMFGHRGIIHSPAVALLLTAIISFLVPLALIDVPFVSGFEPNIKLFGLAFGAGFISHLILDTLNPGGISWLAPFRKTRYSLANIYTNSAGDWITGIVLGITAVFFATEVLDMVRLEEIYAQYLDLSSLKK